MGGRLRRLTRTTRASAHVARETLGSLDFELLGAVPSSKDLGYGIKDGEKTVEETPCLGN